jgi:rubrerythrin
MNTKVNPFLRIISKLGYHCNVCGWEWIPRFDEPPKVCPECKSPDWNKSLKKERAT